jgi:hypothetical protein
MAGGRASVAAASVIFKGKGLERDAFSIADWGPRLGIKKNRVAADSNIGRYSLLAAASPHFEAPIYVRDYHIRLDGQSLRSAEADGGDLRGHGGVQPTDRVGRPRDD